MKTHRVLNVRLLLLTLIGLVVTTTVGTETGDNNNRKVHKDDDDDDDDDVVQSLRALHGQEWVTGCRHYGFDPLQLACQTCQLLTKLPQQQKKQQQKKQQQEEICKECCQPYKDTQSLRKPYQSAILVVPPKQLMDDELTTFLREDWDDLVERQGGFTRLQKINMKNDKSSSLLHQGFWFIRTPAEVHFFDERLSSSSSSSNIQDLSEEDITDMAKETMQLYGWKRDDIRDMIQTLLV